MLEINDRLLEIEQRLIPTGLHVFGQPPTGTGLKDILRLVASFERPERGIRSLFELVADGLGAGSYSLLVKDSATDRQALSRREQIESIVSDALSSFLASPADRAVALDSLEQAASVNREEAAKVFALLDSIRERLETNNEIESLLKALRGEYIEPGPGADIVQNPDILPTGRNTHAVNPYSVPSATAVISGESIAKSMLERHVQENGTYPETIAMVLWGIDNIKSEGQAVAQALWLLGVKPRRDALNRAVDVDVIPLETLRRPRIDVVMTVSGIFRDLFGTTMGLLDTAVRRVAALAEPEEMNFIKKHVRQQREESDGGDDEAVIRVFSNAAGNYGTNVNFMVLDSQWEDSAELGDLFITRKCFAYGRDSEGRSIDGQNAKRLLERALSRVEVTYQNIDTIEVGITDVDHYFEYLGGVTRAVEKHAGRRPAIYLSDTLSPVTKIRTLEETVRLESRTKVLNPRWYEGMLKHGFSGVAEIEHQVSNTFGWSATANAVDGWIYDQVAETYVLDESMLERLKSLNPHSARTLVSRLLEASGRGFWDADESVVNRLREVLGHLEDQLEGIS